MQEPSFSDALQVLLLQAADNGRGEVLFGESLDRASREVGPFMIGNTFPSVYLECPLKGDPYLDVTLLYSDLDPNARVEHPAAEGANEMLAWFAGICHEHSHVCCGFELDTEKPELPAAAVHFQPRGHLELVRPFCEAVGEPERADLYINQAQRMPEDWALAFFGMFRGRPGSPLRICGYLSQDEVAACAQDSQHLANAFDEVGFSAYDSAMLDEVREFLAFVPGTVDFQFDVFPDGSIGDTFAIDTSFKTDQPEVVQKSFESGLASHIMHLFEDKDMVDSRWKLVPEATFARAIPAERGDGSVGRYSFTLMPDWTKARWRAGVLQPAKMYFCAHAGFID